MSAFIYEEQKFAFNQLVNGVYLVGGVHFVMNIDNSSFCGFAVFWQRQNFRCIILFMSDKKTILENYLIASFFCSLFIPFKSKLLIH